ncbi:MAG: cell surface protein SprA [Flavobacteriales bacterium]|nr:cell surface protein SprA [Flavobacteriales bacterium]
MVVNKVTYKKIFFIVGLSFVITLTNWIAHPTNSIARPNTNELVLPVDSPEIDLIYPFDDEGTNPNSSNTGGLYLDNPSNVKSGFEYDPETGTYNYYQRIGDKNFRDPTYMTFDEYLEYDSKKSLQDYWKQKADADAMEQTKGFRPTLNVKGKAFDRIFGGNTIDIRPQGSAELSFGINRSTRDNPVLPVHQRSLTTFDFNQQIQLNVIGNIGTKMKLSFNYNTEATFDFENRMKIEYSIDEGSEDEIIQNIEAGNVALPLKGTLITGSQTLFGLKTELKFGRMYVTSVISQEKGERKEINVQGGAQIQKFEKEASDYEENRHFFLSQYYRNTYEQSLSSLPVISSRATVTRVEVWVSNRNNAVENTKNIIGFMDLGEGVQGDIHNSTLVMDANISPLANFPDNEANTLYPNLTGASTYDTAAIRGFVNSAQELERIGYENGIDFEKYENAKLLRPEEYTLNAQLGYISLNSALNQDDILGVAFQYTLDGQVYQVGEFSTDGVPGQSSLYVKLLRGTTIDTELPMWDLMMKNVYSLGAFNISQEDFFFNVFYLNPATGVEIPFLPEGEPNGIPLVQVLNLDKLNNINQASPDGVFDFIEGVTVNSRTGRVYFPVLEPFGSHIRSKFSNPQLGAKFAFDTLYSTTQMLAKQDAVKNRYKIRGQYSSSVSSDISLNAMNVPQGSVVVTAGGATLVENVQYTVDYNLGRVKIIDEGILQSGTPIKISLESQSLFNIRTKTLMGSRFDYKINDDFNIGGTIIRLSERPLTRKVNIGEEPINNTIWGLDVNYTKETPFITRALDKLPLYSTKEKSSITFEGEFAHLIPGNPGAIGKDGTAYLDDFEGSQSRIDMKSFQMWTLASTPQGQPALFPEGELPLSDSLNFRYNAAKTAWYVIDPLFWRNNSETPNHIQNDPIMQSNHYMREVLETEVFPFKSPDNGVVTNLPVFDVAFYPEERGQYNYNPQAANNILPNPTNSWGGIMRQVNTTDFESSNVEFIQFWVMDPFHDEDGNPNHAGGKLYFNLGNISEDILRDGRKSFENGLPTSAIDYNTGANIELIDTTIWGRVPKVQVLVNAFDNNDNARIFQDIGLDGLNDADELVFFGTTWGADASADNYHHYRGSDYDQAQLSILDRYKNYNGMQGNSPTAAQYTESYSTSGSTRPDIEDINQNNNLDFREDYFQYEINLNPTEVNPSNIGNNYITDVLEANVTTKDGRSRTVRWYQFKIPIREPDKVVGNLRDFKSIRFMRMFMKGFNEKVVLRFARLDLIRGEWRQYTKTLLNPGDYIGNDDDETTFIVGAVNVEENSEKTPVNYIIPPGIDRELNPNPSTGATLRQLNEQSLSLNVCNLKDGDARAAFKVMDQDLRRYKRLKMFVHAEESNPTIPLNDGDLSVFIRMGTDFNDNYYEYEVPLKVTPPGRYDTENTSNESDREIVWPNENEIDLKFSLLTEMKMLRNSLLGDPNSGVLIIRPYEQEDGNNKMRIKGNPNLANVKVFMIGIRNSKQSNSTAVDDDGLAKCAEIWVNELRMTEFDNEGGWATRGRLTAQLADLGTMTLAGAYSTPGFGSVDQKLNERQLETIKSYDVSTSVEMGKFIPEKIGISLPVYYSNSKEIVTPKYNPLDPDIELKDQLSSDLFSQQERDSLAERTQTVTSRKSINFTNVRKLPAKGKEKNRFYDISNISLNYGYSEYQFRDIDTEFDTRKTYKGGIAYSFTNNPKNYKPFENLKMADGKQAKLLKDFNFYLAPKQLSFQTDIDRQYSQRRARNNTGFDFDLPTYYQKHFNWNRIYGYRQDITKALTFDFTATNNAVVNEPIEFQGRPTGGRVDKNYPDEYSAWKDTVMQSIKEFGTNMHYHHTFNLNYTVPIDKLPFMDFATLTAKYGGDYDWQRAPIGADTLGNTIQNSNTVTLNSQLNMTKFYNQINFLKEVEKRQRDRARKKAQRNRKSDPNKTDAENAKLKGWKPGLPPAEIKRFDTKEFKDSDTTKVELWREKDKIYPLDPLWITLMSPKNISGTYTRTRGTLLPGYNQQTEIMGYNNGFTAPGFNFISGMQEDDFAMSAAEKEWLQPNSLMYNYNTTYAENYNLRATLRPINTLRIQLNATRNYSTNLSQQFFEVQPGFVTDSLRGERRNDFFFVTPVETGNLSMSFMSIRTAFASNNSEDRSSSVFDKFLEERAIISQRLGAQDANSNGLVNDVYADGYGATSQEVLIPAFIAGYSGKSGDKVSLKSFEKYLPMPNWRITFDGLSKLPLLATIFKQFTLTHSYRSTFNVSSFTTNLNFEDGRANRDINRNFISQYQISGVSISEQFSPLLGADMTLENSMLIRIEYAKDRNAALSVNNNQITEIQGSEWTVGTGYKFKQVRFPFSKNRVIRSDIDARVDVSLRSNETIIRKIVEEVNQLTSGQKVLSIRFTADYRISQFLNLRAFYDYVSTTPFISTTFPTSNTNAGISLRFTLSQ